VYNHITLKELEDYEDQCLACQRGKSHIRPKPSEPSRAKQFNERVAIDTLEISKRLNIKVATMTDEFSGILAIRVLDSKHGSSWRFSFMDGWTSHYGWSAHIRLDGALEYDAEFERQALDNNSHFERTAVDHPQGNACCERWQRVILDMIRTIMDDSPMIKPTREAVRRILENHIPNVYNLTKSARNRWKSPYQIAGLPYHALDGQFWPGRLLVYKAPRRHRPHYDKIDIPGIDVVCLSQLPSGAVAIQLPSGCV